MRWSFDADPYFLFQKIIKFPLDHEYKNSDKKKEKKFGIKVKKKFWTNSGPSIYGMSLTTTRKKRYSSRLIDESGGFASEILYIRVNSLFC